ncbi:unnamed protein product, partial [Staurois parvus]
MTTVGWEPLWPGSSLTNVWPFFKHLHHSNVLLQLSVSSPFPQKALSLVQFHVRFSSLYTRNFITTCCSMHTLTLLSV